MRTVAAGPVRPFRWDLARPDQLGSLLDDAPAPDLWFADALVECAAKVVARSGGGDLVFVGRSADSLFDLLTGLFTGTGLEDRLHLFPFSRRSSWYRLPAPEVARARAMLAASGVTPATLTARRPVAFVDLVYEGWTFQNVYALVRDWAVDERAQWDVVRRKLRFTGITMRERPSPDTVRWAQDAEWPRELRPSAIRSVAVDRDFWYYLGNNQPKLTRSYVIGERRSAVTGPRHDERARAALAEAVAVVAYGRSAKARRAFVRALGREPAVAEPWLRDLMVRVSGTRKAGSRRQARGSRTRCLP